MNTYLERLIEERKELYLKFQKLSKFLNGDEIKTLECEDIALLEIQYSCMEGYLKVLTRRLEIQGYFEVA